MTNKHEHDFIPLYKQPMVRKGVIILECDCGEKKEVDANTFFDEAVKMGEAYIMDFSLDDIPTKEDVKC